MWDRPGPWDTGTLLGSSRARLEELAPALSRSLRSLVIDSGVAPAATGGLGFRVDGMWKVEVGAAGWQTYARTCVVDPWAPFDLASISKCFLALTVARLIDRGVLRFETPIGELLPESRCTQSKGATLEHLLAHRAGLVAHREFFAPLLAQRTFDPCSALKAAARSRRVECSGPLPRSGFEPLYSDLGFMLAGAGVALHVGKSLDELIREEVTSPLHLQVGSARQWQTTCSGFKGRAVPTEWVPWRGGMLKGVVHDENAWALAGYGAAGHAGLFGTAAALAWLGTVLVDVLADRQPWLSRATLLRLLSPRPGGTLRAGFDGKSASGSVAGSLTGPATFGHLGFTGTSLWIDPDSEIVTVLLTNRVHPSRRNLAIRAARPRIHDALFALAQTRRTAGACQGTRPY